MYINDFLTGPSFKIEINIFNICFFIQMYLQFENVLIQLEIIYYNN